MKKVITLLLLMAICLSLIGCSPEYGLGLDLDKDGKNDANTTLPLLTHTISFQSNGGTSIPSQKISTLNSAPQPTKEGHEFLGWYRDETLSVPVVYPLSVDGNMTLYAKWLKTADYRECNPTSIKFMDDIGSCKVYTITPPGFDISELASRGYTIDILVEYDVYYIKDYDVLWDIGYAGAPKYEVSISNSDGIGQFKNDLTTSTSKRTRTISYSSSAANYLNTNIYLSFSTDNIQNIIYFTNISVTFTCHK